MTGAFRNFALLLILALVATPAIHGQSFAVGQTFPAPTHPNAVATADFNNDGIPDLAVPSYSPNTLAIMMGNGNGGFGAPTTYTMGAGPRFAAIADFDLDGRADVVVANQDSGDISLLLATGPGTFARQRRFLSGTLPYHLTVADLNTDGKPDVVVANSGGETVSVLLGDGAGSFAPAAATYVGPNPRGLTAADFNGDDLLDVAVSVANSNSVVVLLGDGAGSFSSTRTTAVGVTPYWPSHGDFNSDGHVDLAVPNFGSGYISVLLGDGTGGFTPSTVAVGMSPRSITAADLDRDGVLDLLVANRDSNTLSLLRGTGGGTFVSAGVFGTGSGPFHSIVIDADADGELDAVVANRDGHSISVLRGSGAGGFHAPMAFASGANPRGIATGDLNGDGHADVVTANQAANTVSVLFGQGTGALSGRLDLAVKNAPYSPVLGDFDGDGHLDIVVANASSNSVSVLRGNGAGAFATQLQSSAGAGVRALATADFNGDGYLDLATANYNGATASILIGKGNGTFNAPVLLSVGTNPTAVAAGDLNGDNRPDFAVTCAGSNDVRVFLSNGAGTFANAFAYATGSAPSGIAIADLDNDGWPDLAVTNENSNSVSILRGTANGTFAASPSAIAVSTRPLGITTGHLDSDNVPDLVVASATNNMLTVLGGNGDGSFQSPVSIPAGVFSRAVALADFDGDSRLDIAVGNMNGNDVWIVLNQTGTVADLAVSISNNKSALRSGAPVSYEVVVSNLSSADVSELRLQVTVPNALVSPAFTPSAGAYDPANGAWTGLSLGGGQQAVLTVAGTVSENAAGTFKVEARVGPGPGYIDPVVGNNTAEDSDSLIRGDADLQVGISNGRSTVAAGDAVTYTITVSNVGPVAVQGAHVTTLLPGALRNATWSCSASAGATCSAAGSGVIDEPVSLPVGGAVTFVLAADVDERAAAGTLRVSASIAPPSDVVDPVAENDSATDEDALSGDAPPVAAPQSLTLSEDGFVQVEIAATDADGDALTFSIVTPPAHGVLSGTAPHLTYTPAANYNGADTFVFQADDGILSSTATVSLTVAGVNDEPVATDTSISTAEDTPVAVPLAVTDADGDTLNYTIVTPPSHGTLSGTAPALTYTPAANYNGSDTFNFKVSDGVSEASAAVTLTVTSANDTPAVASPIPDVQVSGDDAATSVSLAGRYSDVETPESSLVIAVTSSDPSLVIPSINGSTLNLALAAGRGGSAVITVRVTDLEGASVDDAFTVTVTRPGVSLFISDASRGEGSSTGLVYTVTLSGPSATPVTVNFETADGTAAAGLDYVQSSGTLTFAPGVTSRTIAIHTLGDVLDELDETVLVQLSGATGATLQNVTGAGTIVDDDTATISLLDISLVEGDAGVTSAVFTLTLSTPSSRTVTVNYATANISAVAGSDYVARSGTVIFPAGSNAAQTVAIDVLADAIDEPDQAFSLGLSNAVNASLGRSAGRATIVDDDSPPSISVSNASVVEGNSGTRAMVFTLTLSGKSEIRARVRYQTADGTATAGSDYTAKSGEVAFDPGVTSKTVSIAVAGDTIPEPNEVFYLDLNTPTNATIGVSRATGTITSDEGAQ